MRQATPSRKPRSLAEIKLRDARDRIQWYVKCHTETRALFRLWRSPGREAWTQLRVGVFGDNPQAVLDVGEGYLGIQLRTYLREQLAARGEVVAL